MERASLNPKPNKLKGSLHPQNIAKKHPKACTKLAGSLQRAFVVFVLFLWTGLSLLGGSRETVSRIIQLYLNPLIGDIST